METKKQAKKDTRERVSCFKDKGLIWFYVAKDGLRTHFYNTADVARQAWEDGERIPISRINL